MDSTSSPPDIWNCSASISWNIVSPLLSTHSLHLLMQAARHLQRIENTVLVLGNHAALSAKRRTFSELAVVSLAQNGDGLSRRMPSGPLISYKRYSRIPMRRAGARALRPGPEW
jgi:hypothetical protein